MVNEAILLAALGRDESEALRLVEPLHGTVGAHSRTPVLVLTPRPGISGPTDCRYFAGPDPPRWAKKGEGSRACPGALSHNRDGNIPVIAVSHKPRPGLNTRTGAARGAARPPGGRRRRWCCTGRRMLARWRTRPVAA